MSSIKPIMITNKQEKQYIEIVKNSSSNIAKQWANAKLICANIRLVWSIANKYMKNSNVEFDDLESCGIQGLQHAINTYDISKNVKLCTYAYMWIEQYIQRKVGVLSRDIHVSDETIRIAAQISGVQEQYKQEHGGLLPSYEDIAKLMDISVDKVINTMKACKHIYSLDSVMNNSDNDTSFSDVVADSCNIHEDMVHQEQKEEINNVMKESLNDNEYYVISHRFGLNGCDKCKEQEMAMILGLSLPRIKQIKRQAMEKLAQSKTLQSMCQ